MKVKELIEKLDNTEILYINGKSYNKDTAKDMLEKKITKIDIKADDKKKSDDLESLGYSFEVGV